MSFSWETVRLNGMQLVWNTILAAFLCFVVALLARTFLWYLYWDIDSKDFQNAQWYMMAMLPMLQRQYQDMMWAVLCDLEATAMSKVWLPAEHVAFVRLGVYIERSEVYLCLREYALASYKVPNYWCVKWTCFWQDGDVKTFYGQDTPLWRLSKRKVKITYHPEDAYKQIKGWFELQSFSRSAISALIQTSEAHAFEWSPPVSVRPSSTELEPNLEEPTNELEPNLEPLGEPTDKPHAE